MPCLSVAAVCQAMRRIREISCTWMRKQGLPLGHWLGHKHPFNRLTPHFAPKAGWRVPGGSETEHTDGGRWRSALFYLLETSCREKTGIWLARPSRPEGDHPEQCSVFPFRNNRGIKPEPSLVCQGKNTHSAHSKRGCLRWPDQTLYLSRTEIIDLVIRMKAD